MGSGCGTIGRAVASNIRDPWFKPSHWQILYTFNYRYQNCNERNGTKKRPGFAHI